MSRPLKKEPAEEEKAEITREGRTIVDARNLLQQREVEQFIRKLSASIRLRKGKGEEKKSPSE
jgi:hypothetical protein